jgi:hypothetical protein
LLRGVPRCVLLGVLRGMLRVLLRGVLRGVLRDVLSAVPRGVLRGQWVIQVFFVRGTSRMCSEMCKGGTQGPWV